MMKILLVWGLLAYNGYAAGEFTPDVGPDDCPPEMGPAGLCGDMHKAFICNATQMCVDEYWPQQHFAINEEPTCAACIATVDEMRAQDYNLTLFQDFCHATFTGTDQRGCLFMLMGYHKSFVACMEQPELSTPAICFLIGAFNDKMCRKVKRCK